MPLFLFSAYVVSWVAVGLLFMWILDADMGIVARGLRAFGLGSIRFLGDPRWALPAIAAVAVWKITGRGEAAAPVLARELANTDRPLRRRAFVMLTAMGPAAASARPVLDELMMYPQREVRDVASKTMERLGQK